MQDRAESSFDEFWSRYPRKVGKYAARQTYDRVLRQGADHARIMAGLEFYIRQEWSDRPPDRIPHAATFLNQRRFEDVDEAPAVVESRDQLGHFLAGLDFEVSNWCAGVCDHGMNGQFTPHMQHFARKVALDKKLRDVQVILACCTSYAVRRGWGISANPPSKAVRQ